jgi:hypothetical protein
LFKADGDQDRPNYWFIIILQSLYIVDNSHDRQ